MFWGCSLGSNSWLMHSFYMGQYRSIAERSRMVEKEFSGLPWRGGSFSLCITGHKDYGSKNFYELSRPIIVLDRTLCWITFQGMNFSGDLYRAKRAKLKGSKGITFLYQAKLMAWFNSSQGLCSSAIYSNFHPGSQTGSSLMHAVRASSLPRCRREFVKFKQTWA